MSLNYEIIHPMVKKVAASVSGQFPAYVTADDTEGHLWVWTYEKKSTLVKLVEDDPQNWERKIASTLRKVAMDYCAKEKAAVEGYSTDDLYRYTIPKIKSLLPDVFDYTDWQTFGLKGDGQPTGRPLANQTGDRMVELIDVKAAIKDLNEDTKALLFLQHVYHYTSDNLADHFGITEQAAKKRSQRALGALQKALGRKGPDEAPRPGDGRRMIRSNAAWRAAQSTQYEGA